MSALITTGPKAGRLPCVVMGCGRTFKPEDNAAIICGDHYRLSSRLYRRTRAALKRKARRTGWSDRMIALDDRLWNKIVQQATDRSIGL